jgi:hypothetical protein
MIKKSIVAICLLAVLTTFSYAEETKNDVQINLISVTEKVFVTSNQKIDASLLKKGVFVSVVGGRSSIYQKTADLVKDRIASKGVKVVNSPEDAEIGMVIVPVSFEIDEVESGLDAGINKEHLFAMIGSAIVTGGVSLAGETWRQQNKNVQVSFAIGFFDNPKTAQNGKISGDRTYGAVSTIVYNANQEGAKVSTAVLTAYVDKLIENHFIIEPKLSSEPVRTAEVANTPANN